MITKGVRNKTTDGRCICEADHCREVTYGSWDLENDFLQLPVSVYPLLPPSEYLYMPPDICAPILKTTGLGRPCKGGDSVASGRNIHGKRLKNMFFFFFTSCWIFSPPPPPSLLVLSFFLTLYNLLSI